MDERGHGSLPAPHLREEAGSQAKSVGAREKQREKRLSELLMPPPPNVPNANARNSSGRALQSRDSKISTYQPTLGMGEKLTINPSGVGVVLGVLGD